MLLVNHSDLSSREAKYICYTIFNFIFSFNCNEFTFITSRFSKMLMSVSILFCGYCRSPRKAHTDDDSADIHIAVLLEDDSAYVFRLGDEQFHNSRCAAYSNVI